MNYYISDLHFGHKNVIEFSGRPFSNIEEMDNTLITNWNSVVGKDDNVYIVGDFCYENEKPAKWYLEQLKGKKHLLIGNHDTDIIENYIEFRKYFESINQMFVVKDENNYIVICHYPMCEWSGFNNGYYHFYGHIHNKKNIAYGIMRNFDTAFNVGAEILDYTPRTFDEVILYNQKHVEKR